jgi:hypothetical protein
MESHAVRAFTERLIGLSFAVFNACGRNAMQATTMIWAFIMFIAYNVDPHQAHGALFMKTIFLNTFIKTGVTACAKSGVNQYRIFGGHNVSYLLRKFFVR